MVSDKKKTKHFKRSESLRIKLLRKTINKKEFIKYKELQKSTEDMKKLILEFDNGRDQDVDNLSFLRRGGLSPLFARTYSTNQSFTNVKKNSSGTNPSSSKVHFHNKFRKEDKLKKIATELSEKIEIHTKNLNQMRARLEKHQNLKVNKHIEMKMDTYDI
ncbi:CLUMA_CG015467, isoform A [Clunio marinus]|uniref:CLUMA_CG015467, isoform A n=1 Tax=Clunio marinus TaxID=568069 RepID=A0A1J1IT06_9DIPT|nr:CLUMA_CG015467, isoform A [Clunio marinus]